MGQDVRVPPCSFLSFQVFRVFSNSVIACKRGVPERGFDWRERREERRCEMFMMVLVFFFS